MNNKTFTFSHSWQVEFLKTKQLFNLYSEWEKILTGRIRTIGLGIAIETIYSPPLYQLSYGEIIDIWITLVKFIEDKI